MAQVCVTFTMSENMILMVYLSYRYSNDSAMTSINLDRTSGIRDDLFVRIAITSIILKDNNLKVLKSSNITIPAIRWPPPQDQTSFPAAVSVVLSDTRSVSVMKGVGLPR